MELVLQGCSGDVVRAIEHCLAVDDARQDPKNFQNSKNQTTNPTPTSPSEFFKNLTTPSRPFQGLQPFQPYMVSHHLKLTKSPSKTKFPSLIAKENNFRSRSKVFTKN